MSQVTVVKLSTIYQIVTTYILDNMPLSYYTLHIIHLHMIHQYYTLDIAPSPPLLFDPSCIHPPVIKTLRTKVPLLHTNTWDTYTLVNQKSHNHGTFHMNLPHNTISSINGSDKYKSIHLVYNNYQIPIMDRNVHDGDVLK